MNHIRNLFRIISGFHRLYLPVSFFMKIFSGVLIVLPVMLLRTAVNLLQSHAGDYREVLLYAVGWLSVNLLGIVLELLYRAYRNRFAPGFREYIDGEIIKKAVSFKMKDFEEPETSDIISRARTQSGEFLLLYMQRIADIAGWAAAILSMLCLLGCFHWQAAGLLILALAVWWAIQTFSDGVMCEIREDRDLAEQNKRQICSLFLTKKAYREVRTRGHDKDLLKRYGEYQDRSLSQNKKMDRAAFAIRAVFELLTFIVSGGICVYMILAAYSGRIGLGDMAAYIMCAGGVRAFGKGISERVKELTEQSAGLSALLEYLELPNEEGMNRMNVEAVHSVEFKNVSFRSGRGEYALRDINLYMKSGEAIVISEERSSGKSAFIRLIAGLYDDYEGEILVNGVELRRIDVDSYQKRVEVVSQDSVCDWDNTAAIWDGDQKADLYIFEEPDGASGILERREFKSVIVKNGSVKEVKSMSVS